MELALRARVAWLSRQMDSWCSLDHDLVLSSGGGNWAVRMWAPASTPQHFVTAEIQDRAGDAESTPPPAPQQDTSPPPAPEPQAATPPAREWGSWPLRAPWAFSPSETSPWDK